MRPLRVTQRKNSSRMSSAWFFLSKNYALSEAIVVDLRVIFDFARFSRLKVSDRARKIVFCFVTSQMQRREPLHSQDCIVEPPSKHFDLSHPYCHVVRSSSAIAGPCGTSYVLSRAPTREDRR
jgi:hypothetical protein